MTDRILVRVEYKELSYGFKLTKAAEYIHSADRVKRNTDGSITVLPEGRKRTETYASSMIRELRVLSDRCCVV